MYGETASNDGMTRERTASFESLGFGSVSMAVIVGCPGVIGKKRNSEERWNHEPYWAVLLFCCGPAYGVVDEGFEAVGVFGVGAGAEDPAFAELSGDYGWGVFHDSGGGVVGVYFGSIKCKGFEVRDVGVIAGLKDRPVGIADVDQVAGAV